MRASRRITHTPRAKTKARPTIQGGIRIRSPRALQQRSETREGAIAFESAESPRRSHPTAAIGLSGWRESAASHCPCASALSARVIPHPGHGHPVSRRKGQRMTEVIGGEDDKPTRSAMSTTRRSSAKAVVRSPKAALRRELLSRRGLHPSALPILMFALSRPARGDSIRSA